jgi:hypothetical protein
MLNKEKNFEIDIFKTLRCVSFPTDEKWLFDLVEGNSICWVFVLQFRISENLLEFKLFKMPTKLF